MLEKEYVYLLKKRKEFGSDNGLNYLIKDYENDIINKYKYYIHKMINKYKSNREDLYQAGIIGLFEGIRKFDFSKDVKILTYCHYTIIKNINECDRLNSNVILPFNIHEMVKYSIKHSDLEDKDVVNHFKDRMKVKDSKNLEKYFELYKSIEFNRYNDDIISLEDRNIDSDFWMDIKNNLETKRFKILYMFFNLGYKADEIAEELKVSVVRVNWLKNDALNKLRNNEKFSNKYKNIF